MEQPAHTVPAPEPDAGAAGPQPLRVQAATALARRLQGDALMVAAVPDDDGGCGVAAGAAITAGQPLLKLAWADCLSPVAFDRLIAGSAAAAAVALPETTESPGALKVLLLLLTHAAAAAAHPGCTASGAGSAAQLYIAALPSAAEFRATMPLHWSDGTVGRFGPLLAPTLRSLIDRLRAEISATHAALVI